MLTGKEVKLCEAEAEIQKTRGGGEVGEGPREKVGGSQ